MTLLTIPDAANAVAASGDAPAIAWYGDDDVFREIACDVCGPVSDVQAAAKAHTARELTTAEKADFHVTN